MEYANRKNIILILILTLFSWCSSLAQEGSVELQVQEIKKECERINNDTAKFKVVVKDVFDQSTEGGFLRSYSEDNTLRKAILTLFGETGQSTNEYYLLNGKIIFVLERGAKYKSPIYIGKTEIISREENKFYFKDQKLIRWVDNDGKVVELRYYPKKETEILDDLKTIL